MLITVITLSSTIVLLYFNTFDGNVSNQSSDWANFGAYVGGLITPLISFFALILLFVSLQLQKQEFTEIIEQQGKQLEISRQSHSEISIKNHKQTLLKFLSNYIHVQHISNQFYITPVDSDEFKTISVLGKQTHDEASYLNSKESLRKAHKANEIAEFIAITNFATIDELNECFNQQWKNININ